MFTGIIKEIGKITEVHKEGSLTVFTIFAPKTLEGKKIGESIAVNGVCVTIVSIKNDEFKCEIMEESASKSNLGELSKNDGVNLEPAIKLAQSLDGHLVQGHVDTTTKIKKIKESDSQTKITFELPKEIEKYISLKGSITINGVSLTICDLKDETFSVALIPHTLKTTNLGNLEKEDKVNLEVDIIARYLERLIKIDNYK